MVRAVVARFCETLALDRATTEQLSATVAAVAEFVCEEAYPGGGDGEVEVGLETERHGLRVQIHDWGRPLASGGAELGELPPALATCAAGAEDLRLVNLGRDGKLTTFSWPLRTPVEHGRPAADLSAQRGPAGADDGPPQQIEVRDATPDDAQEISRLLYDHYALGYVHPDFYRPRWVAAQLEARAVRATVALDRGRVVGHHALLMGDGAACVETGVAVVHPGYRGLRVFTRLMQHSIDRATAAGLAGVYGEAVTTHPYSQRAERAHGYRETALLLGSVPVADERDRLPPNETRGAQLVSYLMLDTAPRAVALCHPYGDQLRSAYDHLSLPVLPPAAATRRPSSVRWAEDTERRTATVDLVGWDADAGVRFHAGLRRALARHVDILHANVELRDADSVTTAVGELNRRGFFYAGLRPRALGAHDALQLQRLNCEHVEVENVICDSAFAKELMAAVLSDRDRVERLPV